MATRTVTTVFSDLSGFSDAHTVRFSVGASQYEIDLTDAEAPLLCTALEPFIAVARKAQAAATGRAFHSTGRKNRDGGDAAKVREWARANGHPVNLRGRISSEVRAAYDAAHPAG